ncbi:hypothetical protein [Methylobacter sp.]|uniref:hypothetical protein n=1 Tax=Methylobacter sp. TaxID=2051955 RepID=UPI002FDE299A
MTKILSNEVLKQLDDYAVEYAVKFCPPEHDEEGIEIFNRMSVLKAFSANTDDLAQFLFSNDEALEVEYRKVVISLFEEVKLNYSDIPDEGFDTVLQLIKDYTDNHRHLSKRNGTEPNLVKLKTEILGHINFLGAYLEQAA